jgi:predicted SprT family Zn-dependent metalloprotease
MSKLEWARNLALELMAAYGLNGWGFRFNRRMRQVGLCWFPTQDRPGRIELSAPFVEWNDAAAVEDTIRHEIAHALAGPFARHGPEWVRMCRITGARPSRSCKVRMPPGKWRATCPGCQAGCSRYRRPRRLHGWHCRHCGPERGGLTWNSDSA